MKKLKNAGVLRFSSRFFIALQIDPSGAETGRRGCRPLRVGAMYVLNNKTRCNVRWLGGVKTPPYVTIL